MPTTWIDLPPDHPLFTRGVSFVLRDELSEEQEQDESEEDGE